MMSFIGAFLGVLAGQGLLLLLRRVYGKKKPLDMLAEEIDERIYEQATGREADEEAGFVSPMTPEERLEYERGWHDFEKKLRSMR